MGSLDVTRYILQLGSRDSTTGWYTPSYAEETIQGIIQQKGATRMPLPPGVYVKLDGVGVTADPAVEGDKLKPLSGQYYEVSTVQEHYIGDSFYFRECQLSLLHYENLTGGTYTETTVEDARYRTKVYLETRLRSAYLPNYIAAYGLPDYPLSQVFKTKGVDLTFAILDPEPSKPILDSDHYPIGYEEHVPIETYCIDKTNIDGVKLQTQACMELRYITENYPLSSVRSLDEMRPNRKDLGGTQLYSQRFMLNYWRDYT